MVMNDVHEALYENSEIHGPWFGGSGPSVGLILSYSKSILNLLLYSHIHFKNFSIYVHCTNILNNMYENK